MGVNLIADKPYNYSMLKLELSTFGGYFEFVNDNTSINTFCTYPIVFLHTKHISMDTKNLPIACWKDSMH